MPGPALSLSPSLSSPQGGGGPSRNKPLMALSIKQLGDLTPEASGDGFRLDDKEVYTIRLVARVLEMRDADAAGGVQFDLHDSTGSATCVPAAGLRRRRGAWCRARGGAAGAAAS